jgi:hypothetical protein
MREETTAAVEATVREIRRKTCKKYSTGETVISEKSRKNNSIV